MTAGLVRGRDLKNMVRDRFSNHGVMKAPDHRRASHLCLANLSNQLVQRSKGRPFASWVAVDRFSEEVWTQNRVMFSISDASVHGNAPLMLSIRSRSDVPTNFLFPLKFPLLVTIR